MANRRTIRMLNDLGDAGLAPAADLTVQTVEQVETTAYKFPSPTLVTDAVGPEVLASEG